MDIIQALVLALIQGITEFLPVSSSAHLILPSKFISSWQDQGLAFDTSVHVGTLLAVMIFYRKDILAMFSNWFDFITRKAPLNYYGKLAWFIGIGTIPVGLAGLVLKKLGIVENYLREEYVIAISTIVFGILLYIAEIHNKRVMALKEATLTNDKDKEVEDKPLTLKQVLFIGCAQAIALIPGTSRSGITMTAGYFLGLPPKVAAKFSFLLSIPVIILSALLSIKDLLEGKEQVAFGEMWLPLLIGVVVSFVTAFVVIKLFLEFLTRLGLLPYVIYRLILGVILLVLIFM